MNVDIFGTSDSARKATIYLKAAETGWESRKHPNLAQIPPKMREKGVEAVPLRLKEPVFLHAIMSKGVSAD
jgi:hypothetical protein